MRDRLKIALSVAFCIALTLASLSSPKADSLQEIEEKIKQYEQQIDLLQNTAKTLSSQIRQFDAQIQLTTLQIQETEEKILLLTGRISELEISLNALSKAFTSRAVETYKMAKLGDPIIILISTDNLSEIVTRFHYLRRIQEADRSLLVRLQETQDNYIVDKQEQETLQQKLEQQQALLAEQKSAKNYLLKVTKNDEKKYQNLLAQARAEYEAIQAIIAGKGVEEEVGQISQGETIATIIQGPSCNSDGTHLHFIVGENGTTHNPFNYLKSTDYENCSGSSCGSSDGDPFNPSGSWNWPIDPKIKFTQGYGSTWAVRNTWVGDIYNFHNGIDINSPSTTVRSVASGTLFRGSYSGTNTCRLKYVRVDHKDSNLETYYLHINYK